jgi:excisionase family DNA binding protein
MPDAPRPRFLTLDDVAEELATSRNQVYALVRQGELGGIKIGGRGQWRVGRDDLETYIAKVYDETRQFIKNNPYDQEAEQGSAADTAADPSVVGPDSGHEEVAALAAMANPLPPSAAVGAGGSREALRPGSDAQRDGAELEL